MHLYLKEIMEGQFSLRNNISLGLLILVIQCNVTFEPSRLDLDLEGLQSNLLYPMILISYFKVSHWSIALNADL